MRKKKSSTQENYSAGEILRRCASIIDQRANERGKKQERSMARIVAAFNALFGTNLTETQGWLFMALLKMGRFAGSSSVKFDDFEDMAAYCGLAGECEGKKIKQSKNKNE